MTAAGGPLPIGQQPIREPLRVVLERHAGQFSRAHGAEQVRQLESRRVVADAVGADIGNAIALGVTGLAVRLPRQISAHAVGRRKPRTFADQNRDASRGKRCGDGVAGGDPAVADNDKRRDFAAIGAQRGHGARENGCGVTLDSPRRQAIGNNESDIIVTTMRRQRRIGCRIQATAEIGAHQISLPIRGGAGEGNDWHAEPGQVRRQFRFIKRRMHGIAGAGMRKLKIQHFIGRERRAGQQAAAAEVPEEVGATALPASLVQLPMTAPLLFARPGAPALRAIEVAKHYGGLHAVDGVSFDVRTGSIHAVIGPNGAGKTTLFRMLKDEVSPTSGEVLLFGQRITGLGPTRTAQLGAATRTMPLAPMVLVNCPSSSTLTSTPFTETTGEHGAPILCPKIRTVRGRTGSARSASASCRPAAVTSTSSRKREIRPRLPLTMRRNRRNSSPRSASTPRAFPKRAGRSFRSSRSASRSTPRASTR